MFSAHCAIQLALCNRLRSLIDLSRVDSCSKLVTGDLTSCIDLRVYLDLLVIVEILPMLVVSQMLPKQRDLLWGAGCPSVSNEVLVLVDLSSTMLNVLLVAGCV